jgi:4'-phosphopantetheinyl transferase
MDQTNLRLPNKPTVTMRRRDSCTPMIMRSTYARHPDSWSKSSSQVDFPTGQVDIWKVCLDQTPPAGSYDILSADERLRAASFHFDKDRIQFARCRSALRSLLARYLGEPADEILFEYTASGKPQLVVKQNPRGLQFNVSHSANVALIAVGSKNRIGVDIQRIRDAVDTTALVKRFFSLRERAGFEALPNSLRLPGFFACWTRKESFLKATGDGLSFALSDFSVTTHPNLDPAIEEIRGNAEAGRQWFLADISVAGGYSASVCVDAPFSGLKAFLHDS